MVELDVTALWLIMELSFAQEPTDKLPHIMTGVEMGNFNLPALTGKMRGIWLIETE